MFFVVVAIVKCFTVVSVSSHALLRRVMRIDTQSKTNDQLTALYMDMSCNIKDAVLREHRISIDFLEPIRRIQFNPVVHSLHHMVVYP